MSTPRQKKAAKALVENLTSKSPVSAGQVLLDSGYSVAIANTPSMVIETPGFRKALAELGLTEELIATSLVADIKAKPKNRVKELGLGAEILGMKKREVEPPEKPPGGNTYNFIFSESVQAEIKKTEDIIKAQLIQKQS